MADNPQSNEDFKQWLDQLRKAVEASMAGQDSIFGAILKSLLKSLLGLDTDDRDAPDFEEVTDPAERSRLERDYSQNREGKERKSFGDYRDSVGQWNLQSLERSAAKLAELRQTAEKANGGNKLDYTSPVSGGRITSKYGQRDEDATGGVGSTDHKGLDIGPPQAGTNVGVHAPMTGVVVGAGWRGGYGNMVEIVDIYGMHHRFGHLKEVDAEILKKLKNGETAIVTQGQQFAVMGSTGHSTGVHLHYEQRDGDGNPRNPEIAGHTWKKDQVLPGTDATQTRLAEKASVTPDKAPDAAHPAHVAAKNVVHGTLKTQVAATAIVPPHPHTALSDVLSNARNAVGRIMSVVTG
ncbi:MAG: M23 family metallopeptidase [Rickettsiales bacterium]